MKQRTSIRKLCRSGSNTQIAQYALKHTAVWFAAAAKQPSCNRKRQALYIEFSQKLTTMHLHNVQVKDCQS